MFAVTQESLAGSLDDVSWHGRYFRSLCPFHDDRAPSFLVYEDGARCLGECHRYFSLEQVYRKVSGHVGSVSNSWENRVKWAEWPKPEQLADRAASILQRFPDKQQYLIDRGLSEKSITLRKLGWYSGWYVFPGFDRNGSLNTLVIRAEPEVEARSGLTYEFHPSFMDNVYVPDWGLVQRYNFAFVVAGIFDVLTLAELNFPALTGLRGKNLEASQLQSFRFRLGVFFDRGEQMAAERLASNLDWRGYPVRASYPVGIKDQNEAYTRGQSRWLKHLLNQELSHHAPQSIRLPAVGVSIGNRLRSRYQQASTRGGHTFARRLRSALRYRSGGYAAA